MKLLPKYPALTGLLMLIASVALLTSFHIITGTAAVTLLICGQLAAFAVSPRRVSVFFIAGLTDAQMKEFEEVCVEMGKLIPDMKKLIAENPKNVEMLDLLHSNYKKLVRNGLGSGKTGVRWIGNKPFVSDECALGLSSMFVVQASEMKSGDGSALDIMVSDASTRKNVLALAKQNYAISQRAALTDTEVPLPTIYMPEIIELVFAYGAARQYATVFPLGSSTVKLPRLKVGEDDFGYLGAGAAGNSKEVPEKTAEAELVTFTPNKAGGLIRIPFEISVDTMVALGQWLARYIARQFAKLEDKTLFLADGSADYASQTGIGEYCVANPQYLLKLAAAKTLMTDITLEDLRNLRGKVSPAVLANMAANGQTDAAYYFHPSMEPLLRGFNKYPNFIVFTNENGKPMFDGWPIRWIGVGATNNGLAQPSAFAAFFGDLTYWFMGERGQARVDMSREYFFNTDEIALRALERIDVEAMAIDAMVALQLGDGA